MAILYTKNTSGAIRRLRRRKPTKEYLAALAKHVKFLRKLGFNVDAKGRIKLDKKGFCYILLGIGYIDKYDTETISDKLFFAGREVYKDGIKHGFDHGNNPSGDLRGPNRKNESLVIHHI